MSLVPAYTLDGFNSDEDKEKRVHPFYAHGISIRELVAVVNLKSLELDYTKREQGNV